MLRYRCRRHRGPIPSATKRAVRRRSGFGCSECGCPIIEYHHIVPYHVAADNSVENLIALCPTCHHKADEGGPWSEERVRAIHAEPHVKPFVAGSIDVSPGAFTVKLANISFTETERMLTIGGQVVLGAKKEPGGLARVTGMFHDPDGNPFAALEDNEWRVAINKVYDVEFEAARHLTVWLAQRRVVLRMEITDEFLHVQHGFFRRGPSYVKVTGDRDRQVFEAVSLVGKKTTHLSDSAKESVMFAPGAGYIVI